MIPPLSDTINFLVSASVARRMDSEVMLGTNTLPTSLARPAAKHNGVELAAYGRPCSSLNSCATRPDAQPSTMVSSWLPVGGQAAATLHLQSGQTLHTTSHAGCQPLVAECG